MGIILKRIFKKRINDILQKFKDHNILIYDEMANFFGQESLGVWKIRGNGVLLLTDSALFYEMWKPKKELLIPIKSIIKINNPKSHLHRSVFKPLLKIIFKNQKDEIDSAAWYVQNISLWNQILNELISNKN